MNLQADEHGYKRAAALALMNMGYPVREAYDRAKEMWAARQESEQILAQYLADKDGV
jgi:hypothetical protein